MILVCDFFVISRKVYEKKSMICPSLVSSVFKVEFIYISSAGKTTKSKKEKARKIEKIL